MNRIAGRQHTDLAAQKQLFWMAAALFLLAVFACAGQVRSRHRLERTLQDQLKAEAGLARLHAASAERQKAMTTVKSRQRQNDGKISAEMLLYNKIDELQTRFSPSSLTVSAIERKGKEVSIEYAFKYVNPDYNDFLNTVGYLESANFPASLVSAVEIVRTDVDGKAVVSCSVHGKLLTSAQGGP